MRILEEDVMHGIWMLRNQIRGVEELENFWRLFGPSIERGPEVEQVFPHWRHGLSID